MTTYELAMNIATLAVAVSAGAVIVWGQRSKKRW